ncbi:MAG: PD40 domain-containing protein [Deltaproteobacteria bacterium]|nr:PD40 domain-containing protein [Deltaproteobacteria bacterium]
MMTRVPTALALSLLLAACSGGFGRPPKGAKEGLSSAQKAAIAKIRTQVEGLIVWSSSRIENHDLFLMKTDGTQVHALTQGKHVDWYPRFSPDGKRILFCRSKHGWVSEKDASQAAKWDLYTISVDGKNLQKVVANGTWGEWIGPEKVSFSRGTQVWTMDLVSKKETLLADSKAVGALGGAELQNPHLSPDGQFLAITLRGARRETGIYTLATKTWSKTGEGCQINWFPSGKQIFWVNPSGNGGSEVFSRDVVAGKPAKDVAYKELRYIDIPGRRSHEYFPKFSPKGDWLIWVATRRGHDHDIADYEIYLWHVGSPAGEATRLTFHSGNDRWPDIYVP